MEVEEYRRRSVRAATTLIIVIDADALSVQERLAQLDRKLDEAGAQRIRASWIKITTCSAIAGSGLRSA